MPGATPTGMEGRPRKSKGETQSEWELAAELSYLLSSRKLSLVVFIDEAFVQQRYQSVRVDVGGEVKLPVRLVDPPLLLQLGGRLSIICGCGGQSHLTSPSRFQRAGAGQQPRRQKQRGAAAHILDSSRYLDCEQSRQESAIRALRRLAAFGQVESGRQGENNEPPDKKVDPVRVE